MAILRGDTVNNPFGAPVISRETVASTMDEARLLASQGMPHGTVVTADYQDAGRGRMAGRVWTADRGKNLFCTIMLRYPDWSVLPQALTLRAGLAVAEAIEDFAPSLQGAARVKWPNDILMRSRKAVGILTEGDGKTLFIGIGVNLAQTEFPEDLRVKATSILLACQSPPGDRDRERCQAPDARERLLERILLHLHGELAGEGEPGKTAGAASWLERLQERLYLRGRRARFIPGPADSPLLVEGTLTGIGPRGELLITPDGEAEPRAFITGELRV